MRRRLRSIVWWAGVTLVGIAAVLVFVLDLLVLTNPSPSARPGWRRGADMPDQRGETASAVVRDHLVVIGGFENIWTTSADVVAYSPAARRWRSLPDLPSGRHHAAAAGLGGAVYVTGGGDTVSDWSPRRETWLLGPGAAEWRELPPMPEGRLGHDLVAHDGRVYVIGGDGDTARVLVFDPAARRWSAGAATPGPVRDHLRAVVAGDEIWAIGGRDGDDLLVRVDVYDPAADAWRSGPDLPEPMSAMAVGFLGGRIHVVGGEDPGLLGGGVIDRHWSIAPGERRWRAESEPVLAVHGAGFGVIRGRLYVAGGASRQGALSVLSYSDVTQSFAPGS